MINLYAILEIPIQDTYAIGKAKQVIEGEIDELGDVGEILFEVSEESFMQIVVAFKTKRNELQYVLDPKETKITINSHFVITPRNNSEGTLVDIKPPRDFYPSSVHGGRGNNLSIIGDLKQLLTEAKIQNMSCDELTELENYLFKVGQAVRNLAKSKYDHALDLEHLDHCLNESPNVRGVSSRGMSSRNYRDERRPFVDSSDVSRTFSSHRGD